MPVLEDKQLDVAPQIFGLVRQAMRRIGAVGKSHRNETQRYDFRGIDDIVLACNPVFADLGIDLTWEVLDLRLSDAPSKSGGLWYRTVITIRWKFGGPDGRHISCDTIGEGMDTGDKSANKAMSAALKYALIMKFLITTEEPKDSENENPDPMSAPKIEEPKIGTANNFYLVDGPITAAERRAYRSACFMQKVRHDESDVPKTRLAFFETLVSLLAPTQAQEAAIRTLLFTARDAGQLAPFKFLELVHKRFPEIGDRLTFAEAWVKNPLEFELIAGCPF